MLNLLLQLDNFNDNNVYFYENQHQPLVVSQQHQLVMYRRLNYLHPDFTLNNVIIPITFENVTIEPYYDKFKYKFANTSYNQLLIGKLNTIELNLLKKAGSATGKKMQLNLLEQLKMGHIKVTTISTAIINRQIPSITIFLKIIGTWENNTDYGLNFKVFPPELGGANSLTLYRHKLL